MIKGSRDMSLYCKAGLIQEAGAYLSREEIRFQLHVGAKKAKVSADIPLKMLEGIVHVAED